MTMDSSPDRSSVYNGTFNRIVYPQPSAQQSNQQQQQQYHHHHHYHLQHHMAQQNAIPMSGLPSMQCNLGANTSMAPNVSTATTIMHQPSPNQCYSANKACIQHSHPPQQLNNQPVYNQIYQSLQTTYQSPAYQPAQLITADLQHSTATIPRNQQRLFGNTFRQLTGGDTDNGHNLSLNLQQQLQMQHQQLQPQNQKSAPMLATLSAANLDADKSSTLPVHFSHNISPSITNATGSSFGPMTDMNLYWHQNQDPSPQEAKPATTSTSISKTMTTSAKLPTTNQRSKLVESSNASSNSTTGSSLSSDSKLKSYLTHLVLASNVPFAYAIILVAFLITVIAATSIITILTIVLTITGYTAYPLTENTFNTSLVIGVVCASFALALVTASLVVWRRHCQAAYYYLDDPQSTSRGTNSPQLSETYDDSEYGSIPVCDWAKHVQKLHSDGDIGFSREFERIQKATSPNLSFNHSQLPENKQKNRYINIVAYDHTRVTLRPLPGQKKPGSDYINANFIDGYNKPRAYIGTQGPLVSTFDDYWRMIWEQRVVIIVMITNLQERGRRKCDMYWPKEGTETYGAIQVKLLQEVVMATYTLRTFTAKNLKMKKRAQGSERIVYQYHYTNWPDHGVPDHPLPVLSFVRKSASANPSGAGAIICHCSAGCGRSGTYIVIDAMLKQIRHRQSINVVDFLKHIRNQRNYLVQTEEQYVFIHDALVEAIESGETEISSKFIAKYIQLLQTGGKANELKSSSYSIACNGMLQSPNGPQSRLSVASVLADHPQQQLVTSGSSQSNLLLAGQQQLGASANKGSQAGSATSRSQSAAGQWSLLERQYRLVSSFKAKDFNVVSALKPCNKTKNRTLNLIPLEAHRVHITPKPGADGTDYINATFLMGFNHLREFILTQHPVQETYSDFWQMVYDHNSQTVVLLSQMSAEFGQFWPQKDDEVDYGSFKVKLVSETTTGSGSMNEDTVTSAPITTRDFILRSNQDYYELQTRIIHCPGWPESCGPLSNVFELIQVVQQAAQQQASQHKMHDGLATSTTVTIGQEHEPQNGGPIIVVDKFGGTEAATFAVLTTLFKQINFEDAVDVYMYAKLAHLRRPGIWSSQDDYLFLYRAIENYATRMNENQNQAISGGHQLHATGQASPAAPKYQTMTLDRHRHKSLAANAAAKSQTMRRGQTGASFLNQSNQKQALNGQVMLQQNLMGEQQLSKSQLLIDHNNNQLVNVQQPTAAAIMMQRNHLKTLQLNSLHNGTSHNNSQNNSPYNSAVSIGAQSHQHLLATTNGRSSTGANLLSQQQPQQQSMDHYLYTVN